MVLTTTEETNPTIYDASPDSVFVRRGLDGFYDENFSYKVVDDQALKIYSILGRHTNLPVVVNTRQIEPSLSLVTIRNPKGEKVQGGQLCHLSGADYYSLVYQTLTALRYIHSLRIVLGGRSNPENYLYDSENNSLSFLNLSQARLAEGDFVPSNEIKTDIVEVTYLLLWMKYPFVKVINSSSREQICTYLQNLIDNEENELINLAYRTMLFTIS